MKRIRANLTEQAKEHLQGIYTYSEAMWGTKQAKVYLKTIFTAISRLERKPTIGKPRDDLRKGLRTYRVEKHVIFYRILDDDVELLINAILHGRMEPSQHLE